MADLRTQLLAYVEATVERVSAEDVLAARALVVRPVWKRRPWRRPVVVALAAAAAVIVLVGGIALFSRWLTRGGPVAPITTTTTTTTTLPPTTTTTTVPSTTSTTVAAQLDPAVAAQWADFATILPTEGPGAFPGDGHIINDLASNGSVLVAVGDATSNADNMMRDGLVWISSDGQTWERVSDPDDLEFGGKTLNAVVAGGPGFVMGGGSVDSEERGPFHPALWTSVDGRDWMRVPNNPALFGDGGSIYDLLVRPTEILAVGLVCYPDQPCASAVWSSPDGLTWRRDWVDEAVYAEGHYAAPNAIAENEHGLVMIGVEVTDPATLDSIPAVWTSEDGLAWERLSPQPDAFTLEGGSLIMWDLAAGPGGLVAVGHDGTNGVVWLSVDGSTWERLPIAPEVFGGAPMTTVIPWSNGYLAAGPDWAIGEDLGGPYPMYPSVPSRPTLWWSPEGRTWYRIGFGAEDAVGAVRGLVGFNGMLVAGGQSGTFMDGQDALWVNETPPAAGGG
jgi:hypothetical protein